MLSLLHLCVAVIPAAGIMVFPEELHRAALIRSSPAAGEILPRASVVREKSSQAAPRAFMTPFEQWRFGNPGDNMTLNMNREMSSIEPSDWGKNGVFTASPEMLRRCANSVLTAMPESDVDQHGSANYFYQRLTDFLDIADHIYVICIECKKRFPKKLAKKVSILNGHLSDECLVKEGIQINNKYLHVARATLAHRVAIADAQAKNVNIALVLEEDATLKNAMHQFNFEPITKAIQSSKEWDVLRLAWYDSHRKVSKQCWADRHHRCHRWAGRNTCKMKATSLHSASAYMLPAKSYHQFLLRGRGGIDAGVLNQFDPTILVPALFNQPAYMQEELHSEDAFKRKCIEH